MLRRLVVRGTFEYGNTGCYLKRRWKVVGSDALLWATTLLHTGTVMDLKCLVRWLARKEKP